MKFLIKSAAIFSLVLIGATALGFDSNSNLDFLAEEFVLENIESPCNDSEKELIFNEYFSYVKLIRKHHAEEKVPLNSIKAVFEELAACTEIGRQI